MYMCVHVLRVYMCVDGHRSMDAHESQGKILNVLLSVTLVP